MSVKYCFGHVPFFLGKRFGQAKPSRSEPKSILINFLKLILTEKIFFTNLTP